MTNYKKIIAAVSKAAGTDDTLPAINGVALYTGAEFDATREFTLPLSAITFVATDGYMAAAYGPELAPFAVKAERYEKPFAFIPTHTVALLLKGMAANTTEFTFDPERKTISVYGLEVPYTAGDQYPPVMKLFPEQDLEASCDQFIFSGFVLKKLAAMATAQGANISHLNLKPTGKARQFAGHAGNVAILVMGRTK